MNLQDYLNLKAQIKDAVNLERETRKNIIVDNFGTDEGEGTKKTNNGNWFIKAVLKKGYKFKKAAIKLSDSFDIRSYVRFNDDMHDISDTGLEAIEVAANLNIPASLFKVSVSVSLSEYRKLTSEQKDFINQFIEVKQESPTLELKYEGENG
jgi:hypothetical protein